MDPHFQTFQRTFELKYFTNKCKNNKKSGFPSEIRENIMKFATFF